MRWIVQLPKSDISGSQTMLHLPYTMSLAATSAAGVGLQTAPEDGRHDILGPGCGLAGNAVSSCPLVRLLQAAAGLPAGRQEAHQLRQQ